MFNFHFVQTKNQQKTVTQCAFRAYNIECGAIEYTTVTIRCPSHVLKVGVNLFWSTFWVKSLSKLRLLTQLIILAKIIKIAHPVKYPYLQHRHRVAVSFIHWCRELFQIGKFTKDVILLSKLF